MENIIKFFANKSSLSSFCGEAYTSRGRLCDAIRSEYRARYVKDEIESIKQYKLVLREDENVCDDEDEFSVRAIYGYRNFSDDAYAENWYLKRETAEDVYGETNEKGEIVLASLNLGHLVGRRTGEYPYSAYLRRNDKGMYCRINIDPENEGHDGDGKLCFPDKSWDVNREGFYQVEVVRDMGNYAFIRGRCPDFSFDELNLVLDHLWAKGVPLNTYVQKVSGSMFGTFYAYANDACWGATTAQRDDYARAKMYHRDDPSYRRKLEESIDKLNAELDSRGTNKPTRTELGFIFQKAVMGVEPDETSVYEMLNDVSDEQTEEMFEHIEWKKNIGDLFIEGAYGDIHSKVELYALFTKSGYLCERVGGKTIGPRNGKKVKGYWFLHDADSNAPDVVLDAFDAGILRAYSLDGIRAIAINENTVREVLEFSRDELDTLTEYVRKVNEQADAAIDEKLAHGKLKLC